MRRSRGRRYSNGNWIHYGREQRESLAWLRLSFSHEPGRNGIELLAFWGTGSAALAITRDRNRIDDIQRPLHDAVLSHDDG